MADQWRIIARDRFDLLGEGPMWSDRANAVYWVDILGQRVNRLSLASDHVTSWAMPELIGWVIEREQHPGFIAGLAKGFAELNLDPLCISPIAELQPGNPANRMNDAKADRAGRIFAGMKAEDGEASGALFRLDPDLSVVEVDSGYAIANGPAISPDGAWMYHTDSALNRIFRFEIAQDGSLGPRHLYLEFPPEWGSPDGMTIDADGGLWVAHWGGGRVSRFWPDGTLDRAVALPASQITSCTFAGPDLDRMFVTSAADGVEEGFAGQLFEVDPAVKGLPTMRFRG
ncbi:SMP-30/gluconolactonase/LRE family protein [uncultured Erythrobacter sp.]|uniref:SMP-30/gluconolactonase/LRE family protein n=1 Tax=uncultured Erythrobacter sp. TaxID=263913 RepID=UPI00265A7E1B|nr:SMP-30/gluconolactonase/LRE family protein [uncultured Erythrobacter sp.]